MAEAQERVNAFLRDACFEAWSESQTWEDGMTGMTGMIQIFHLGHNRRKAKSRIKLQPDFSCVKAIRPGACKDACFAAKDHAWCLISGSKHMGISRKRNMKKPSWLLFSSMIYFEHLGPPRYLRQWSLLSTMFCRISSLIIVVLFISWRLLESSFLFGACSYWGCRRTNGAG